MQLWLASRTKSAQAWSATRSFLPVVTLGVLLVACNPPAEQANAPAAPVASPSPTMSATEAAPSPEPAPTLLPPSTPMPAPSALTPHAASYTLLVTNSAARMSHLSSRQTARSSRSRSALRHGAWPWHPTTWPTSRRPRVWPPSISGIAFSSPASRIVPRLARLRSASTAPAVWVSPPHRTGDASTSVYSCPIGLASWK